MKTKFHFIEAILTLIPLASVLGRNDYHYENLLKILNSIYDECEKWRKICGDKDELFFSQEIELDLDVESGCLALPEWKSILLELQSYVNKTSVSFNGKFYRMTLFSKLNQAIVLLSQQSATKKGWEGPKKELYHDFSSFPKNK